MKAHVCKFVILAWAASSFIGAGSAEDKYPGFPGKGSKQAWQKAVILYDRANGARREKHVDDAIKLYDQAIDEYPLDPAFYANLALVYENDKGNFKKAEQLFQKSIQLAPESFIYRIAYAGILLHESELPECKQALANAARYAKTPEDRARLAKARDELHEQETKAK